MSGSIRVRLVGETAKLLDKETRVAEEEAKRDEKTCKLRVTHSANQKSKRPEEDSL